VRNLDAQTLLVHAALHPEPNDEVRITTEPVASKTIAAMQLDFPAVKVCFFGHTHRASCYQHDTMTHPTMVADELNLDPNRLYLLNPGSVGQSRDQDLRATFCIYDTDQQLVQFMRVEYDYLATRSKLARTPGILPRRSFLGRVAHFIGIK
jgi:predicted phosphodiesterase